MIQRKTRAQEWAEIQVASNPPATATPLDFLGKVLALADDPKSKAAKQFLADIASAHAAAAKATLAELARLKSAALFAELNSIFCQLSTVFCHRFSVKHWLDRARLRFQCVFPLEPGDRRPPSHGRSCELRGDPRQARQVEGRECSGDRTVGLLDSRRIAERRHHVVKVGVIEIPAFRQHNFDALRGRGQRLWSAIFRARRCRSFLDTCLTAEERRFVEPGGGKSQPLRRLGGE
jgi:hypothetical protein